MDFLFKENSIWEPLGIKCKRCERDILVEVLENGIKTNHICCERLGCTYPQYHVEEILQLSDNKRKPKFEYKLRLCVRRCVK